MVRMQVPGEDNLTHLGTEEEDNEDDEVQLAVGPGKARQAALINQSDELDQYDQIHKDKKKRSKK